MMGNVMNICFLKEINKLKFLFSLMFCLFAGFQFVESTEQWQETAWDVPESSEAQITPKVDHEISSDFWPENEKKPVLADFDLKGDDYSANKKPEKSISGHRAKPGPVLEVIDTRNVPVTQSEAFPYSSQPQKKATISAPMKYQESSFTQNDITPYPDQSKIRPVARIKNNDPFIETPWHDPKAADKAPQKIPPYSDTSIETYYEPANKEELAKGQEKQKEVALGHVRPPYRLKIGDRLTISLYGFEGGTMRDVMVDPTGHITYLFVNRVSALGKTVDQVRKELEDKVKPLFPNVLVTVSATQLIGNQYSIMGEVNSPGTRPVRGYTTILTAIADAGGFPLRAFRNQTIDYADLDRAFLARRGEYVPVDFNRLMRKGDLKQDRRLEDGDYIYIPSTQIKEIYVLGEFNRPFMYTYLKTATLAEVVAWAGGITVRASSRIVVVRGSLSCPTAYLVDINRISKGCACDFILQPGDIVFAPVERFYTLKMLVRAAVSTFISALATDAGNQAFIELTPAARGTVNTQSLFINPGTLPPAVPVAPPIIIGP